MRRMHDETVKANLMTHSSSHHSLAYIFVDVDHMQQQIRKTSIGVHALFIFIRMVMICLNSIRCRRTKFTQATVDDL